jgi:hypothetical protein
MDNRMNRMMQCWVENEAEKKDMMILIKQQRQKIKTLQVENISLAHKIMDLKGKLREERIKTNIIMDTMHPKYKKRPRCSESEDHVRIKKKQKREHVVKQ